MENKKKRLAYLREYDKENTIGIYLKLNRKTDADVIQRLRKEPNKQGYIKALIRADIERSKGE